MDSHVAEIVVSVLFAGAVNWIVTQVLVVAGLFEECREWVVTRGKSLTGRWGLPGKKLAYFVKCPLCVGVWIGFAQAGIMPGPVHLSGWMAWADWIVNGLLYKAVGHLFFQINGWFHAKIELMNAQAKVAEAVVKPKEGQKLTAA